MQSRCSLPCRVSPTPPALSRRLARKGRLPFRVWASQCVSPLGPYARLSLPVDANSHCEQVRVSRGALLPAAASLPHFDVLRLGETAAARVPAVRADLLKGLGTVLGHATTARLAAGTRLHRKVPRLVTPSLLRRRETKSTSPMTGGELEHPYLTPNYMLRRMIRDWDGARKVR